MDMEGINIRQWKANHIDGKYFNHFLGYNPDSDTPFTSFAQRLSRYGIDITDKVICEIGIGYGRLASGLGAARQVYGIDVSDELFAVTSKYLTRVGFAPGQFVPVLSSDYKSSFPPSQGDLVYSAMTMQHIPKTLQLDYLLHLSLWLKPGGKMLIQFLVGYAEDTPFSHEPHFWWRAGELFDLLNAKVPLTLIRLDIEAVKSDIKPCYWAWAYLGRST